MADSQAVLELIIKLVEGAEKMGGPIPKLVVATEGCCKGHLCDNCKTCQKGRCCRNDNPNYKLPELGEWDGPIYGELGELRDDGEKVECHICGEYWTGLGIHVSLSHDLTSDEYRSIFGLMRGTKLVSISLKKRQSESMLGRMALGKIPSCLGQPFTAEQRTKALEATKQPRLQYRRAIQPEQIERLSRARNNHLARLKSDQEYAQMFSEANSRGHGGTTFIHAECKVCSASFVYSLGGGVRKTCSKDCLSILKSKNNPGRKRRLLSATQASEIKALYATGDWSRAKLAKRYGVGASTIAHIVVGHTYRNLEMQG